MRILPIAGRPWSRHPRLSLSLTAPLLLSLSLLALCAPACNSDSNGAPRAVVRPAPPDERAGPKGVEEPVPAEFGLDQRPSNPTCVAPPRPADAGGVKLEQVFAGVALDTATAMAQPPGDGTRWFVAERAGKILSFPVANPPAQVVVADIAAVTGKPVVTEVEGGLLNIAFHPRFADNGRLFISFTTTGTGGGPASEIGYLTSPDRGSTFTSYTKVLGFDRETLYHCGGGLAFGKDGLLFASFGDGARQANGQIKTGFFAKVLRIDVDNVPPGQTYGIPDGNPFKAGGGEPAAFAIGLRNPFRISVDRATGELWVGDVGEQLWEEVNRVQAGGNYGWPCREGAHDYAPGAQHCPSRIGLIDPIVEHAHTPPPRSVTGGIVYRGAAMPSFQGTYVYGDYSQLEAWALSFDEATGAPRSVQINKDGPHKTWVSFAEDVDGEIYVVTVYQSEMFKLVPATPASASAFPDRLSKTGCVDPGDAKKPAPGLVPYGVNTQLWSDGAGKERMLAVPDGKTITVGADGDFDLPVGSVLVKTFTIGGKRVETRLFVRHDDGEWAGYSYEWDDAEQDAVLLPAGKSKTVGDQTWAFPSRGECVQCHTAAAGRSLGLELAQLNGEYVYPSTNRRSNQLKTLEHIGLFTAPLGAPAAELPAYPDPFGGAPLAVRARSYLHGNCSMCHRPSSGAGRATMDLRFSASLLESNTCGAAPVVDDLGIANAKLVAPGSPETSVLSRRMHALDAKRMPPLGTRRIDADGVTLIDDWIRGLTCP